MSVVPSPRRLVDVVATLVLVVAAMVALVAHSRYLAVPMVDDAAISLAYARTFYEGHGWRLTPASEVIEGFSNPLWTLLIGLALPFHIRAAPFTAVLGTTLAVAAAPVYALWGKATRGFVQVEDAVVALVMAASSSYVYWGSSGMETGLQTLLMGASGALLLYELRVGGRGLCGIPLGLLCLTRPEGPLYVVAMGGFWVLCRALEKRRPGTQELQISVWLVLVFGPYLLFRRAYFDTWLPNTYLAKARTTLVLEPYLYGFFDANRTLLLVALGATMAACATPGTSRRLGALAFIVCGAGVFFVVRAHGDWMREWRFFAPLTPLLGIGIGAGLSAMRRWFTLRRSFTRAAPWVVVAAVLAIIALEAKVAKARSAALRDDPELPEAGVAKFSHKILPHLQALGLRHPRIAFPDVGGLGMTIRQADVVDVGLLTDFALAEARYTDNDAAGADYLLNEVMPDYLDFHGPAHYLKGGAYTGFLKHYKPLRDVAPELDPPEAIRVLKGLTRDEDPRCPGGRTEVLALDADALARTVEEKMRGGDPELALRYWQCAWAWKLSKLLPAAAWRSNLARESEVRSLAAEHDGNLEWATRYESLATVLSDGDPRRRHRTERLRARMIAAK